MSETEHSNISSEESNLAGTSPDMASTAGAQGPLMAEEMDVVEVVSVELEEGSATGNFSGFRWWYVPALGMPALIGTGAAAWYLTKGEEPFVNAWERVTRPARNVRKRPSLVDRTKKAAKSASAAGETLRARMSGMAGGLAAAGMALALQQKAGDIAEAIRERAAEARAAANSRARRSQRRGPPWRVRNRAPLRANDMKSQAQDLMGRARGQLLQQGASATAKVATKAAQVKGSRAAKKTTKTVKRGFKRVRAFAFAMLVTAMVIYVRSWYTRQRDMDTRATASERMEPDTQSRVAGHPSNAAATTATNIPD